MLVRQKFCPRKEIQHAHTSACFCRHPIGVKKGLYTRCLKGSLNMNASDLGIVNLL